MTIETRDVYAGNDKTNETIVTFRKGSDEKRPKPPHSVSVLDAENTTEAITAALNSDRIQNLIAEGEL